MIKNEIKKGMRVAYSILGTGEIFVRRASFVGPNHIDWYDEGPSVYKTDIYNWVHIPDIPEPYTYGAQNSKHSVESSRALRAERLETIKILSGIEVWSMLAEPRIPDYLFDNILNAIGDMTTKVMNE